MARIVLISLMLAFLLLWLFLGVAEEDQTFFDWAWSIATGGIDANEQEGIQRTLDAIEENNIGELQPVISPTSTSLPEVGPNSEIASPEATPKENDNRQGPEDVVYLDQQPQQLINCARVGIAKDDFEAVFNRERPPTTSEEIVIRECGEKINNP